MSSATFDRSKDVCGLASNCFRRIWEWKLCGVELWGCSSKRVEGLGPSSFVLVGKNKRLRHPTGGTEVVILKLLEFNCFIEFLAW